MKILSRLTVVAFTIILASCASQNNQQSNSNERSGDRRGVPTFAELLSKMDANEDGKLAKDEIKGPLANDFSSIDTDEDGFISETEFNNAPKPQQQNRGGQQGGGQRR